MTTIEQLRAASPNRPQANTLGAGAYWAADTRNRHWDLLVDVVEAALACATAGDTSSALEGALMRLESFQARPPEQLSFRCDDPEGDWIRSHKEEAE